MLPGVGAWASIAVLVAVGMQLTDPGGGETPRLPPRIRTESRDLAQLAARTHEQSATFRNLIAMLEGSDVVVYLTYGPCAGHAKACLRFVSKAGPHRYVLVKLDQFLSPFHEHPGLLAHELQHAVDVSRTAEVVDDPSFLRFVASDKQPSTRDSETLAQRVAREVTREVLARTK